MTYTPIKNLRINDKPSQVFLIKDVKLSRTREGKYFTGLVLTDKTGEIKCTIWDEHIKFVQPGQFCQISGRIYEYKEQLAMSTNKDSVMPIKNPANIEDYIYSIDGATIERLYGELTTRVQSVQNESLKELLNLVLEAVESNDNGFSLRNAPLTDEKYGNYCGALLEHIVNCTRHAEKIVANYYDKNCAINPDILQTILILHDIGRVNGLTNIFSVSKTYQAELEGMANLSYKFVASQFEKLKSPADPVLESKILHGILTCCDIDSTPKFIEALIAQQIQHMDALVSVYAKSLNGAKPDQLFTFENPVLKEKLFNG